MAVNITIPATILGVIMLLMIFQKDALKWLFFFTVLIIGIFTFGAKPLIMMGIALVMMMIIFRK